MRRTYELAAVAISDVIEILAYLDERSEVAAAELSEALYETFGFLAEHPRVGHVRSDLTSRPVLFWTVTDFPSYTVIYRIDSTPIRIVRVVHGKQITRRWLRAHI